MLALDIAHLAVTFPGLATPVLAIESLQVDPGARVALSGASGSGKSTFVNIVTGLERTRSGRVAWNGVDLASLGESARDNWRGAHIGLVMQDFHLFPGLSAIDNILLPARLAGAGTPELKARASDLMARVGLHHPEQRIETMSRGEMQRVAVARAVLRRPGVIVADEPTASLDPESGDIVGSLLLDLAEAEKCTLIIVSHDRRLTDRLDRRIVLEAGRIIADSVREKAA